MQRQILAVFVAGFLFVGGICYTIFASMVFSWMASLVKPESKVAVFGMALGLMQAALAVTGYGIGAGVDYFGWGYFPDLGAAVWSVAVILTLVFRMLERRVDIENDSDEECCIS